MSTETAGFKRFLDIQLIEQKASKDFHRALDLGVDKNIVAPIHGAIFLLSRIAEPSHSLVGAAYKLGSQLAGWANPRL